MKDFQIGATFLDGNVTIEASNVAIRFYTQQTIDCITKTIPMDLTLEELHELNRMITHAANEVQSMRFSVDSQWDEVPE